MNLIEQLGGYKRAKATLEIMLSINESHKNNGMIGLLYDASTIQELSDALLEYRSALSKEIKTNRSKIIPVDHKTIQKFADYQDVIASQQSKIEQLEKQIQRLEKSEFKLAQIKSIIGRNPNRIESVVVKEIKDILHSLEANQIDIKTMSK